MSASDFDAWALSVVEGITGVDRAVWDVYARTKFLNWLVTEGDMQMEEQEDGTIVLMETEEKTSAAEPQTEVKSSEKIA